MKKLGICVLALFLALAFSGITKAQGISVGLGIGQVQVNPQNSDLDSDTGMNYQVDAYYNFSEQWAAGLKYDFGNGENNGDQWRYTALDVVGRYTYSIADQWGIYGEAGIGYYGAENDVTIRGNTYTVEADPVLGYCAALGGLYSTGKFYVGPEVGYHSAPFDKGTVHGHDIDGIDTITGTTLLVKFGILLGG